MCAVIFPGKSLLGRYLLNRINNNQQLPCTAFLFAFWSEGFLSHALLGSLHYCDGRYNTNSVSTHTQTAIFSEQIREVQQSGILVRYYPLQNVQQCFTSIKLLFVTGLKVSVPLFCLTGFQAARGTLFFST